ncbi:MAG TPA: SRPBCC family protein [Anaeromyxobacter sp.]|nr:SRPBCC family protein [Anaeromyxobacter sp.]
MAKVTKQVTVDAPIERFYDLVVDYERYPEFVPGIHGCRVLTQRPEKHVEYQLDLGVKRIRYVLRMEERRPTHVSWSLVSGEMMKMSSGSWELSPRDGRTHAVYTVEIQITRPPLVPQAIVDRVSDELTRVQLPRTLDAFKARAERAR